MTPIYCKTGVLFRDSITVQSNLGVFNNALVDANWTKALSNGTTGGVTTTGITITKTTVDVVGKYDVLIPASILSANGNYTLTVYETANPANSHVQEYIATTDGTPSGAGSLLFTASANDGRVKDGAGSPVVGATVYLSYSGYISSVTTIAGGLWSWPSNPSVGTVTITVVKSGYATTTSALTVGASSITGPLTDITIVAVSNASTVVASDLWSYTRRMAHNKNGAQADIKIQQADNDALDKLAQDIGANGNWYIRKGYLAVKAPYSTGTIALTEDATTCVLTGGTFPSWAANGRLYINGQPIINISARNSATSLTLAAAYGGTTNATASYVLYLDNYALESNAYEFMGIMNGQSWPYMAGAVTIERLWEMQNSVTNLSQRGAWYYAVANNRMHLYPYPSQDAQVAYIYRARPAPLASDADIADIDPTWIGALRKQINCQVVDYFGECVAGTKAECDEAYDKALSTLVGNIKTPRGIGAASGPRTYQDYWRAICRQP